MSEALLLDRVPVGRSDLIAGVLVVEVGESPFNAGFFIFSPSATLFNYYLSLLELPGRFDSTYPEQNLLNYAHREGGNMPWRQIDMKKGWNTNLPNLDDLSRVKSVHVKGWAEEQYKTTELSMRWGAKRDEMEKYFGGMKG